MAWTLGGVIREQARRRRDAPMITYGARTITWSEMDARASRVAQALLAAGLAEQSRVAFLDKKCPTSVDFAESLPRNPSGKILKRELREPYWQGRPRRVN
jgi:acyl-CoA synthetase (AMP-forming)/AMP-acid ligase II